MRRCYISPVPQTRGGNNVKGVGVARTNLQIQPQIKYIPCLGHINTLSTNFMYIEEKCNERYIVSSTTYWCAQNNQNCIIFNTLLSFMHN